MISIQSAMLVVLGFLSASLLALLIAPLFWSRAVRLTTRRIKDTMPISDVEIRADKDRIRAEYAIKVHKLESEIESVRLSAARQQIEINRRDASVNELEREVDHLKVNLEETTNARRVLEQTVADRLPRVEQRLNEAKKVLYNRDREIVELTRNSERQTQALTEAKSINAQHQAEIDRLNTALASRARSDHRNEARSDAEISLRAEIEQLRAKTREQAQLLARLQSFAGRPSMAPIEADAAGRMAANDTPAIKSSELAEFERQLRTFKARNEDQAAEIMRLKGALAVFENDTDEDGKSLRESRIGLKARAQALEAQSTQQSDTIQRLRSELAAANERLARQANHFQNELRRLGPVGSPATGGRPARLSLNERVIQSRQPNGANGAGNGVGGPSGSNVEPLPVAARANAETPGETEPPIGEPAAPAASAASGGHAAPETEAAVDPARAVKVTPSEDKPAAASAAMEPDRRPRLIDRLSSLARS